MHVRAMEGGEVPVGLSEGGNRGTEEYYLSWGKVAPNTKVTEYSVPVSFVRGL